MKRKIECSGCGLPLELDRIGKYRYCLTCHAQYMQQNRRKHSELNPEARKRATARAYLNEYIRRGKIVKGPCEVCGSTKVEAHHDNYAEPLKVKWLCRKHHIQLHQTLKS